MPVRFFLHFFNANPDAFSFFMASCFNANTVNIFQEIPFFVHMRQEIIFWGTRSSFYWLGIFSFILYDACYEELFWTHPYFVFIQGFALKVVINFLDILLVEDTCYLNLNGYGHGLNPLYCHALFLIVSVHKSSLLSINW